MPSPFEDSEDRSPCGLAAEVAEVARVADRDRWGLALVAIGWSHLAVFLVCHALYLRGDRSETHFLGLWWLDLGIALVIARKTLGGPARRPALVKMMIRVWATFLILCFSSVSLNKLTGLEVDWFKPAWGNLATFGFAMMAWLFHPAFLVVAVQMSLTALLIAARPDSAYAIYGVSWCLALTGVGAILERRRAPRSATAAAQSASFQALR